MAAAVMASSAILQHLSRAATGVTAKNLCRFSSSCASISGGGSAQLRLKLLPRQQRRGSIRPSLPVIVARANDSPLNHQVMVVSFFSFFYLFFSFDTSSLLTVHQHFSVAGYFWRQLKSKWVAFKVASGDSKVKESQQFRVCGNWRRNNKFWG